MIHAPVARFTNRKLVGASLFLLMLAPSFSVSASPILAIDLVAGTPGIQSSLSVAPGTSVMISVVAFDDGTVPTPVAFDFAAFDITSSAAGTAPLTTATAGSLAGTWGAPVDFTTFLSVAPGTTLTPTAPGSGPASLGFVGYSSIFAGSVLPPMATPIGVIDFTVLAGAPGSSTLSIMGMPAGSELGSIGFSLFPGLLPATLSVTGPAGVPEPGTFVLFGLGLIGIARTRGRRG